MIRRQEGNGVFNGTEHFILWLANAHTADGVSVETDFHKAPRAPLAQVGV